MSLAGQNVNCPFIICNIIDRCVYLDELVAADLGGVTVVGEGDTQLASVHVHSGLRWKRHRTWVEWRSSRLTSWPVTRLLPPYLEFLPSDGLHVALLADGEVVGDFGVPGVDVGPAEGVARLGDLSDHLVVAALCDDVIGDACRG